MFCGICFLLFLVVVTRALVFPNTWEKNMAMLAERKKKQKWSADPRNTNWSNGEIFLHIEISSNLFVVSCLFAVKILHYAFGRAFAGTVVLILWCRMRNQNNFCVRICCSLFLRMHLIAITKFSSQISDKHEFYRSQLA